MAGSRHTMETLALGRPFELGKLYDACKEALLPGALLQDANSVETNAVTPLLVTEHCVIESDTIDSKLSALKVPESLKASLLCGLVEPKGAAGFWKDSKRSSRLARIALHYSATTKTKQVQMSDFSYPSKHNLQTATHVVSGMEYGAEVFFVFDQEVSSSEQVEEVQQSLRPLIERVPGSCLSEGSEGIPCLAGKEKARAEKITCRIYGDVVQKDHPVTFQEAVEIYSMLPRLLSEKAVPVRIHLHPLNQLNTGPFYEISSELIGEIQNIFQWLMEEDRRCSDLAQNPAATTFPATKRMLQFFQALVQQFRDNFQKRLSRTVPLIRRREEEEDALADLLSSKQQSLFSRKQLNAFLDRREEEMMFVNSYLEALQGVEVVSTKKELDRILANPILKRVIAFVFTSLQDKDPYLSELEHSLAIKKGSHHRSAAFAGEGSSPKPWFERPEVTAKAREQARAFLRLTRLCPQDTKCIVSALPDEDHPGVSIYLYEEGKLVNANFEPPSKPSPLVVGDIGQNAIQLTFNPVIFGKAEISGFQVERRIVGQEAWVAVETKERQETFGVTGLQPDTEYHFRYASLSKVGASESSDISEVVRTLPINSPGRSEDAIAKCPSDHSAAQRPTLAKLDSCRKKEPPTLPKPAAISVPEKERIAVKMIQQSTVLEKQDSVSVYRLPLKPSASSSPGFKKYRLGSNDPRFPHKVIMMLGATGAGKTTLINGMINFILGVKLKDSFRFKLIQEVTSRSQAHSQTSEVTAYEINYQQGLQIPYTLTIVDTPGFNDSRGIEHDKQITEQIRHFFSTPEGIDHIDGVCFVVQAPLARLTPSQKYVFDSVLCIFGKDIKANIQILATFADGQTPPVLEAILESEVPCAKDDNGSPIHFKFNNSAWFPSQSSASEGSSELNELYWKIGIMSMKKYFEALQSLEARSLTLTKEVLRERKRLETTVEGLQPQIKFGLTTLEELQKTKRILEQHKDEMEANKDFEFEIEKTVPDQIKVKKEFLTNCQTCHFTCHYPCMIANDTQKYLCAAMDAKREKCTVCPGKCVWNVHFNQKYRWEYKTIKEKQTYGQIKANYEKASKEAMTMEKVFEHLQKEYAQVEKRMLKQIEDSTRCIDRLQEIALKPNPMATPDHIDLLIEAEKQEAKPGFQDRIKALERAREMAVTVSKIARDEPLLPPKGNTQEP
ncbi:uncharacterized protein LOC121933131 [Sceloporus undulatus]|uniref:uncharacterized protein LOC121933131 n=1 Tax=Sceloporus undulatus TaxID=8520 RepID=UPI001C4C14E3|nr:uncharacterized protein LOC121933131 [Sceloporus undulatus]